ncbi:MAG: hypothetical protein M3252_03845 [Actinomycetota bacterium]|nr:hypothetical protein [Actinomycetota bacterium]
MLPALLNLMLALPFLIVGLPGAEVNQVSDEQIVAGRLGGDARLEGGCVWLDPVEQGASGQAPSRFEPLWPAGYYVTFGPVRLWSPEDRVVAEEGDVMTVGGRMRRDLMTICQVGTPFEVRRILTVNDRLVLSG